MLFKKRKRKPVRFKTDQERHAYIMSRLKLKGVSFASIAEPLGKTRGYYRNVSAGEVFCYPPAINIAKAIGEDPRELWENENWSRYEPV